MHESSSAVPDLAASGLLVSDVLYGQTPQQLDPGCSCYSVTHIIEDGLELFQWSGLFEVVKEIQILDDSNRICFSFNSCAKGGARCSYVDGGQREYDIDDNSGRIQYGPGRRGTYCQKGAIHSLSVLIHPDLFESWVGESQAEFKRLMAEGGVLDGYRGGELRATARMLHRALVSPAEVGAAAGERHPLWLRGQCMTFVSLFLEEHAAASATEVSSLDRRRLMRARDRLLEDLSRPPVLADLAREAGLSPSSMNRGFRKLFGASPFALFQRERMVAARQRLLGGDEPILSIAADFGYTNASHFSTAFRKQFGLLPGEIRRTR